LTAPEDQNALPIPASSPLERFLSGFLSRFTAGTVVSSFAGVGTVT